MLISNKTNNRRKFAFTLAEVLIVIGIIGVVAEMTIPSLMSNVQTQAYQSGYTKVYSELSQVAKRIMADAGMSSLQGVFVGADDFQLGINAKNQFANYMQTFRTDCDGAGGTPCWYDLGNTVRNSTNNSLSGWTPGNGKGLITNSGMYIMFFHFYDTNCSTGGWDPSVGFAPGACGGIIVDINGAKPPNRYESDVFQMNLFSSGLIRRVVAH